MSAKAILAVVRGAAELVEESRETIAQLEAKDREQLEGLVKSMTGILEAGNVKRPRILSEDAKARVLRTAELLKHIISFSVDKAIGRRTHLVYPRSHEMTTAEQLGRLSLVCHAWRHVAQDEGIWEPLAKSLIPRLRQAGPATSADLEEASESYRRYMVREGRLLHQNPVMTPRYIWNDPLVFQVEISFKRPYRHIFSGEGRGRTNSLGEVLIWLLDDVTANTVPPFSIASLAPSYSRSNPATSFSDINWNLSVRITVRDMRTGKKGVLWNNSDDGLVMKVVDEHVLESDAERVTTVTSGSSGLSMQLLFELRVEPDQEGLPEDQQMFSAQIPELYFFDDSIDDNENSRLDLQVARFVLSTLQ